MAVKLSCTGGRMETYTMSLKHTFSSSSKNERTYTIDDCSPVVQQSPFFPFDDFTYCSCTRKDTTQRGALQKYNLHNEEFRTLGGHPDEEKSIIVYKETHKGGFGENYHSPANTANGCMTYEFDLKEGGTGGTTLTIDNYGTSSSETGYFTWDVVDTDENGYTISQDGGSMTPFFTFYPHYRPYIFYAHFSKRITSKAETYTVPQIVYNTDLSGKTSDLKTFLNTSTRAFTTFARFLTSEEIMTSKSNHYSQVSENYYDYYPYGRSYFRSWVNPFRNILTTIICDGEDFVIFNSAASSYDGSHSYGKAKKVILGGVPPEQSWLSKANYQPKSQETGSFNEYLSDVYNKENYNVFKLRKTNVSNWDINKWSEANFDYYQLTETSVRQINTGSLSVRTWSRKETPYYAGSSGWHAYHYIINTRKITVNWVAQSGQQIQIDGIAGVMPDAQINNYFEPLNIKGWSGLNFGFTNISASYPVGDGFTGFNVTTATVWSNEDNNGVATATHSHGHKYSIECSPPRRWAHYQPDVVYHGPEHFLQATNVGKVLPQKANSNFFQDSDKGIGENYFKSAEGIPWPAVNILGDTGVDNNIGAEASKHNQAKVLLNIRKSARNYKFVTTYTKFTTIAGEKKRTTETQHFQSFGLPVPNFTDPETAKQFWSYSITDITKTNDSINIDNTFYKSSSNKIVSHALGLDYNRPPNASTYHITESDDSNWETVGKARAVNPMQGSWYGPIQQNNQLGSPAANSHMHESYNVCDYRGLGAGVHYLTRFAATRWSSVWLEVDKIDRGVYDGLSNNQHGNWALSADSPYITNFEAIYVNQFGGINVPEASGYWYGDNQYNDAISPYGYGQDSASETNYYEGKDEFLISPIGVGGIGYDGSPFTGYIANYVNSGMEMTSYKENDTGGFDSAKTILSFGTHKYVGTRQTFFAANPFQSINNALEETTLPVGTPFSIIFNPFAKKRNIFTDSSILSNNPEYFPIGMPYQEGVVTKVGKPAKTNTSVNEDDERVTFIEQLAEMPVTGEMTKHYEYLFNQVSIATWNGQ
jgi:hypothetical protein